VSSEFFTNEEDNTLKNKINHILQNDKNITYLDFLIGYFRITGFDKIASHLQNIEHTRILVGINADRATYEATQIIEQFATEQIELCDAQCQNFISLQELVLNKKISIRITPDKDVHSKMYIMRSEPKTKHDNSGTTYLGSVIIGSSNLTHNGLEKNTEINAELKDNKNVEDAVAVFEKIWETSVELTEEDYDTFILPKLKSSIQEENPTPCDTIYYHILAKYFSDIIDNQVDIDGEIKLFDYQKDAVNSAVLRLNRFNGAILGDVVGLGKTVIACGILKVLNLQSMIIAPPATHKQWIDTLEKFNISSDTYTVCSYDKLPKSTQAQFVILDESHKVRTDSSDRYEQIEKICKHPFRKKVLLMSATLQNNSPKDIANQVYLFQDRNGSTLPNIISLEKFFKPLIKEFDGLKLSKDKQAIDDTLKNISSKIRTNILQHLLIRRTRTDIQNHEMYKNDIDAFPKIDKLNTLQYNLGDLSQDFKSTIEYLETKLDYARFKVLNNLNETGRNKYKDNNPKISDNIFDDNDLSTLAKYSYIKRFESSLYAFKISINNSIATLTQFIKDLEEGKLYVGKNSNDVLQKRTEGNEKYFYEGDKIYYIKSKGKKEKIYLKGVVFKQDDFKDDQQYLTSLKQDLKYFKEIREIWKDKKEDPKFDSFLTALGESSNNKIVVFTEYKDTLDFLESVIPADLKSKTLFISSKNRKDNENKIAENFDANYDIQKEDYRILVTTDTLAEGVNLHKSDTLINYDLPWNSTKLMQRMGRINRIGSSFETLNISSFKPVDESNHVIGIMEKSFIKLQSFHYTLGEDSKILFDDETVESFGVSEEADEELEYLQQIRDFKDKYPNEFKQLIECHESSVHIDADMFEELAFFDVGHISYFYKSTGNEKVAIDFLTFIKSIEETHKTIQIKSNIDDFIASHIMKMNALFFTNNDFKKLPKKDKEARLLLREWYQEDKIDKNLYDNAMKMIEAKSIQRLSTQIIDLSPDDEDFIDTLTMLTASGMMQADSIQSTDINTKIYIQKGTK